MLDRDDDSAAFTQFGFCWQCQVDTCSQRDDRGDGGLVCVFVVTELTLQFGKLAL